MISLVSQIALSMPQILSRLHYRHFEQMEQLELRYYGAEFITPAAEAWRWYERYPYTVLVAAEGDKVIGFVNLFPVRKEIFDALQDGTFNDHYLTPDGVEDIYKESDDPLYMFLSCILVEPEYRARGITRELLRAAVAQYERVSHRCTEVITDNVTAEGEAFSRRFGFNKWRDSNHSSVIYRQTWEAFSRCLLQASTLQQQG